MSNDQLWVKILLAPFSWVYGFIINLRKLTYQIGLQKSSRFDVPTICVGNLSVGGAGKSPHVEYLMQMLEPYIYVGVLSRGYRRKTDGFRFVEEDSTAIEVGDEPLQFKKKTPSVIVAVGERRAFAIPQMLQRYPDLQTVILDDAFQHLAVTPYLSVLITEFSRPYTRDYLLPSGNLRESRSEAKRADIIVVSKCPIDLNDQQKQAFLTEIAPLPHQRVYFSYYSYGMPYHIFDPSLKFALTADTEVFLITGIARTDYLLEYLNRMVGKVTLMAFEDHRLFTNYDVAQFKFQADKMTSRRRVVLTTEKDATRLALHRAYLESQQLEIYALPIQVQFLFEGNAAFDADIKQALLDFRV
jgi:tetraacyldisaccharide 4'-kinase